MKSYLDFLVEFMVCFCIITLFLLPYCVCVSGKKKNHKCWYNVKITLLLLQIIPLLKKKKKIYGIIKKYIKSWMWQIGLFTVLRERSQKILSLASVIVLNIFHITPSKVLFVIRETKSKINKPSESKWFCAKCFTT